MRIFMLFSGRKRLIFMPGTAALTPFFALLLLVLLFLIFTVILPKSAVAEDTG